MAIIILDQNGVDNTNIDGATFNDFTAGKRSGVILGALNECDVFGTGNVAAVDTGILLVSGVRIKITTPLSWSFAASPTVAVRYQIIASVEVAEDITAEIICRQDLGEVLAQENIFATEQGRHQVEIGKFTHAPNGLIEDCIRTLDRITGGKSNGGAEEYIKIGDVTTETLAEGLNAEVDVENVIGSDGKPKTNFAFHVPKGDRGKQGVQGLQGETGETGAVGLGIYTTPHTGDTVMPISYIDLPQGRTLQVGDLVISTNAATNGEVYKVDEISGTTTAIMQLVTSILGATGEKGDAGAQGEQGPQGEQGLPGAKGDTGAGLAAGGTVGQVLAKKSATDYDTEWETLTANEVGALPDTTLYGATIDLSYTANTGVLGVTLKDQNGNTLNSDTVDLPLELLIQSGSVQTCTTANVPVNGYVVGDKYIDLVLANSEHIYILVSDLVDQVTITETGTGNAVTDITVSGNVITKTKGKTFVENTEKGVANGVAELDPNGKVPSTQLPEISSDADKVEKTHSTDYEYTDGLVFTFVADHYIIGDNSTTYGNGYTGMATEVIIPKYYDDGTNGVAKVTEIGGSAFYNNKTIEKVILPDSIEDIGTSAFYSCTYLERINIPEGIEYLYDLVFAYCQSLLPPTIPNTVRLIGNSSFYGCEQFTEITLPESVEFIADDVFSYCTNLKKITLLSKTPPSLYAYSFYNTGITSTSGAIYVPYESLEAYKTDTNWVTYAAIIYPIPEGKWVTDAIGDIPTQASDIGAATAEQGAKADTAYQKPADGIPKTDLATDVQTSLGKADSALQSVTFALVGEKPTTIVGYGITDAYTKTEVDTKIASVFKYKGAVATYANLPTTNRQVGDVWDVTDTGKNYAWNGTAWDDLGGLVDLSNYFTKTEVNALLDGKVNKVTGKALSTNDLTDTLKSNYDTAYTDSHTHSNKAVLDATTASYTTAEQTKLNGKVDKAYSTDYEYADGLVFMFDTDHYIVNKYTGTATELIIPKYYDDGINGAAKVTIINSYSIQYKSFTSITIPNSVTNINTAAFYGCTAIKNIIFPNSLTSISTNAFYGCSSLKSITLISTTPPTLGSSVFDSSGITPTSGAIYVPYERLEAYKTDTNWVTYAAVIYPIPEGKWVTDEINSKVDETEGKGLSTHDYDDTEKSNNEANTAARHTHDNKSVLDATTASFLQTDKTKLTGIAANAQVNVIETVKVNGVALTPSSKAVDVIVPTQVTYTATLPSASWTGTSAPYSKAVTVSGILSTDIPDIDLDLSSVDYANVAAMQTNWAKVYRAETSANTITFYATEKPSADIKLKIKVVR